MTRFLARLNGFMPLFMAVITVLALVQLFELASRTFKIFLISWIRDNLFKLEWCLGIVVFISTLFLILGLLRATGKLPQALKKWTWLMDILDRLTNRQALEERLRSKVEPVFIDAAALAESLKAKVVGQDMICVDLAAQIRRRLALQSRGKPVGVFLFAGPPGSGKTYLGKTVAQVLERKLVHLDMTQYSTAGLAATSLFGAPKGYVGSDSYGKLTSALRDTPNAVILLDEFEKAHSSVHKNFLTAWNDGFITEVSNNTQISTTGCIFILTTNAAIDSLTELSRSLAGQPDELRSGADAALRASGFAPEVLSRIDRIFVFSQLQDLDIARVAALEIESMIQGYGLSVETGGIDPEILYDLMARQKKLGNAASSRDLVRAIEESIADSLIDAKEHGAQKVELIDQYGRVQAIFSQE